MRGFDGRKRVGCGQRILVDTLGFPIARRMDGLPGIVERSLAWLGRNRRFGKDCEYRVRTSVALIDVAATRFMLNRIAPGWGLSHSL